MHSFMRGEGVALAAQRGYGVGFGLRVRLTQHNSFHSRRHDWGSHLLNLIVWRIPTQIYRRRYR